MSASNPTLVATEASAPQNLARARRAARRVLWACVAAFVASTLVTVAAVVHNDTWPFAAIMNKTKPLMATAACGLFLFACAFASKRVRASVVPLVCVLAIVATAVVVVGHGGVRGVIRPLWNSENYDAAIIEYGDTFWASQRSGDEIDAATAIVRRVSSDEGASEGDLRAGIHACDVCIKRLEDDIAFLTEWPSISRSRLRERGVPARKVEWYANAWERTNDLNALIETSTDASELYRDIRRTFQRRLGADSNEPVVEGAP